MCHSWASIARHTINKWGAFYINYEVDFKDCPITVCEAVLKSIGLLDLDLPLVIDSPVHKLLQTNEGGQEKKDINSKLLSKTINNLTNVTIGHEESWPGEEYLSYKQIHEIFQVMSTGTNLKRLTLENCTDLSVIDQRMLAKAMLNVKDLTLNAKMDMQTFFTELTTNHHTISKLDFKYGNFQVSDYYTLSEKDLNNFVQNIAKGLSCLTEVSWTEYDSVPDNLLKDIFSKISLPTSNLQHLNLSGDAWEWATVTPPTFATAVECLQTFYTNNITQAQAQAVEGFPGVEVVYDFEITINKDLNN